MLLLLLYPSNRIGPTQLSASPRSGPVRPTMDEQAGPGVFFNNNSGSSGGVAAQPGEFGGEAARAHFSVPGILHFLQHEWARFEVERAQWDVERAELQVTRFGFSQCSLLANRLAAFDASAVCACVLAR